MLLNRTNPISIMTISDIGYDSHTPISFRNTGRTRTIGVMTTPEHNTDNNDAGNAAFVDTK